MVHKLCMKLHGVSPFIFIVPLLFCSPLRAQTDQPFSVQVSGTALWTAEGRGTRGGWDPGVEGQIRWTRSAWSLGAGVQFTSSAGMQLLDRGNFFESHASTLGFFLEPRYVVAVFGDRMGLYFFGRMTLARISEDVSGTRDVVGDDFMFTGEQEAFSLEATVTGFEADLGPGLLIRLTSRVNVDLGFRVGFGTWGNPELMVEPQYDPHGFDTGQHFWVLGGWVGLVIGIG